MLVSPSESHPDPVTSQLHIPILNIKVSPSSHNRFAVNAPISWSKRSLNSFRSSCGTGVVSLGSLVKLGQDLASKTSYKGSWARSGT